MHSLWIILACFAGMFAFGFLLAGVLGCQNFGKGDSGTNLKQNLRRCVDVTLFFGLGTVTSGLVENWSKERDARRMVYVGLLSLAALAVFGYLVNRTG